MAAKRRVEAQLARQQRRQQHGSGDGDGDDNEESEEGMDGGSGAVPADGGDGDGDGDGAVAVQQRDLGSIEAVGGEGGLMDELDELLAMALGNAADTSDPHVVSHTVHLGRSALATRPKTLVSSFMRAISERVPQTMAELQQVRGMGRKRLEKYVAAAC